jgi:hypothetical protein
MENMHTPWIRILCGFEPGRLFDCLTVKPDLQLIFRYFIFFQEVKQEKKETLQAASHRPQAYDHSRTAAVQLAT